MLEKGTKVWCVDNNYPFKIREGEIDKYKPQHLGNFSENLEFYSVYITDYDRLHLYHRNDLYFDHNEALQARIEIINTNLRYEKANLEDYTDDIVNLKININECKNKINKLEKLLVNKYNIE